LQPQYYYNFIESIAYFIAAIVPIYFLIKSKNHNTNSNNKKYLENISIVFVSFIILQGFYHIDGIMEFKQLAKGLLEPLSILVLLLFGLIYLWYVMREKKLNKIKQ
jgi:L-lactate permease